MPDDQSLPDSWEETEDPPRLWIRLKGGIAAYPIVNGLVNLDDGTTVSADVLRDALRRKFGPGAFIDKDMKKREI
jgi:hypothetical protein